LLRKIKRMPLEEIVKKVVSRFYIRINSIFERKLFRLFPIKLTDFQFYESLNLKTLGLDKVREATNKRDYKKANQELLSYFRTRKSPVFFYSFDRKEEIIHLIKSLFPDSCNLTIQKANLACEHIFDLLGSGPTNIGNPIDWMTNFAGRSWLYEYYQDLNSKLFQNDFQNENYIGDVKLPWELNKHLHFVDLGKAYWLTGEEKYAKEFITQLLSWIKDNPFKMGVNWTANLIVAQRVISWIFAFNLFLHSPHFDERVLVEFLKSLLLHGRYIPSHFEFAPKASNHLIGNVCGLFMLGFIFPEFKESKKWRETSLNILYEQVAKQVYNDGVDYEQSTSYHRYVIEFCLIPIILCLINNIQLSKEFMVKIEKMLEFIMHILKPNGHVPPISDADGARVFNFNNLHINDHRSYLALGALIFNRGDFKEVAGDNFEEILWFFGADGFQKYQEIKKHLPKEDSKAFYDGGYFVMRNGWEKDSLHLFFDCGHIGMGNWDDESYATHGHSDLLNFGLYAYGQTFITDIGSYTYTGSKKWHDYFRSSKGHNLIIIDNEDQSILTTTWAIKNRARPLSPEWFSSPSFDYVSGAHTGYRRLSLPIIHLRKILFIKPIYWIIIDNIEGEGEHIIESYFHIFPDCKVNLKNQVCHVEGTKAGLCIFPIFLTEVKGKIIQGLTEPIEGWYSYDYGQKEPAPVLKYSTKSICPTTIYTVLYPYKNKANELVGVEKIIATNQRKAVTGIKILFSNSEDYLFTTPVALLSPIRTTSNAEMVFIRKIKNQVEQVFAKNASTLIVEDKVFIQSKEKMKFFIHLKGGV